MIANKMHSKNRTCNAEPIVFKSLLLHKLYQRVNFCIDGKIVATNITPDHMTIKNPWRPNDPKMSPAQFSRFSRPFTSKWGALTSISRFFTRERFYGFLMFCMFFVCFSYLRKGIRKGDWHGTLVGMNFGLTCHYIPAKPPNFNFCCFTSKITRV